MMTILYVKEPGAVVRRDVERIKVTHRPPKQRKDKVLHALPIREVEQVILYGNVQLTTQAAALLMDHDIDVVYLSQYGKYRGRLSRGGSKFARLRHAQLRLGDDPRQSLALALAIVRAKLANQRNLLQRLNQNADRTTRSSLSASIDGINSMRNSASRASSLDALRGFEGKAGAYYFAAIRTLLDPTWRFTGRAFHPAPDPFNALLSFGYSLLLKDVSAVATIVGLDPYIGCFHALEYGRPSLVLDLMEEFRPVAVDESTLRAAIEGRITVKDFIFTGRKDRPVELQENKLREVIELYEQTLNQTLRHGPSQSRQTLRRILELQARIYARVVLGNRKEYDGCIV